MPLDLLKTQILRQNLKQMNHFLIEAWKHQGCPLVSFLCTEKRRPEPDKSWTNFKLPNLSMPRFPNWEYQKPVLCWTSAPPLPPPRGTKGARTPDPKVKRAWLIVHQQDRNTKPRSPKKFQFEHCLYQIPRPKTGSVIIKLLDDISVTAHRHEHFL